MACIQDPILLNNKILVDKFQKGFISFISHAHSDHLQGISKNAEIYCTKTTKQLIYIQYPKYSIDFHILSYNEPELVQEKNIIVTAIPAFHCDGSCMFLFQLENGEKILITSDFRLYDGLPNKDILSNLIIDRLYYDDLFDEIKDEIPTHEKTLNDFSELIFSLKDDIIVNCSILGFEMILRMFLKKYSHLYNFQLSEKLKNHWRGKQIEYLLPKNKKKSKKIILGHKNLDDIKTGNWIFPSFTKFLCPEKYLSQKENKNHYFIQFATHSNQIENDYLKCLVSAKQVSQCGQLIQRLKCLS